MQMGRFGRAHTGQRASQLITAVLNDEISRRSERRMKSGAMRKATAEWIGQRTKILGRQQAAIAVAQIFKDDLLELAGGDGMQEVIDNVGEEVLEGELRVQLSPKPEANRPLTPCFDFIYASFDTSNLEGLSRRAVDHILNWLRDQLQPILAQGPRLRTISQAQDLIVILSFCARFVAQGSARMNSTYSWLAVTDHLQVSKRQIMVSREMLGDLRGLWRDICEERWTPIVVASSFWRPCVQGASSDASGSLEKGWGLHAFGAFAHGLWAPRTRRLIEKRKLSINALELLAAAAEVVLIYEAGRGHAEDGTC